nr:reverse transcriptase domain-containing protein [Tanacetum cinerariifolium]
MITSVGAARQWQEKEPSRSIHTWEDLVSKFINEFFPPSRTTNLLNEISTFQQRFDESFHKAWDRYKDLLRACPHHGFTKLHQLDTFYNPLNPADQDCLNAVAGGNLLERRSGSLPSITVAIPKGELKTITTQSGHVLDGPTVPTPPIFINPKDDERVDETLTDRNLAEYTIKVPPPPKMLKALLSNKEKLQELANTPINENCSAIILKYLPEKLGDPGKFLIPCGFSELKCKSLADLGDSINLMPLSVWKKLGLPELISTRMSLKLANRAICTPVGIVRDVLVPVDKFTFPGIFVIVDYESDPRVPVILGRPFLRTARAINDVYSEEMILYIGVERLTLNMRHDTSSYSNIPQKESINLINIFNDSSEDFLEDLFSINQPSGYPTFSSHLELTSPEIKDDIFDSDGGNVLTEKLLDLDSTKDIHPPLYVNQLSGSTTYSSSNPLLKELANELALITFPLKYDDDLYNLANLTDNVADLMPEMFTDEHALDYSSPLIFDEYDDDFLDVESDTENVYDDPFDSKGEKIKESKLLIDKLNLLCDFLPSSEYDSFIS